MNRSFMLPLLLLSPAFAQTPAQMTLPDLPPPLPYVQNLESLTGKTVLLKKVHCVAAGKPDAEGRMYLLLLPSNRVRVARLEYNNQGKDILEVGQSAPIVKKYFDKYVEGQQEFSRFTLNTLLGLWRAFGLRFNLENVEYSCQLS